MYAPGQNVHRADSLFYPNKAVMAVMRQLMSATIWVMSWSRWRGRASRSNATVFTVTISPIVLFWSLSGVTV